MERLRSARGRPRPADEHVELDVESLAYGGNGVARLNGYVVFVRRGLPGDRVRARVTKVKRNFAEALADEVVAPGPQRVDAPCAHYPACGGCRFQDLAYEAQLAQKQRQVADSLAGSAGSPSRRSRRSSPRSVFHYRNKLEYSFTQTPSGPALGFHKAGRWDEVLEIEQCWLDDRPRQRDSKPRPRLGARGAAARRTRRRTSPGTCGTSSSARGGTPARRSCSS